MSPLKNCPGPHYVVELSLSTDYSLSPPSCLPASLDTSTLVDITPVGALWRKYLDPDTGRIHDGAEYAAQAYAAASSNA